MKHLLFTILIFSQVSAFASFNKTMYVAAKSGLNVHKSQDVNSPIIAKLNYGDEVVIQLHKTKSISINGFETHWERVNHGKGAGGYIIDAYLLPIPPPESDTMSLIDYAEQLSSPIIPPIINNDVQVEGETYDIKTAYKNGIIHIQHDAWEYFSNSLIIPKITLQQAFIITQNLSFSDNILLKNKNFPTKSQRAELDSFGNYKEVQLNYRGTVTPHKSLDAVIFTADTDKETGAVTLKKLNEQVIIIYEYGP